MSAATRWPWHVKVTRTSGTVSEDDYSDGFDALGYAKFASKDPSVERVELSVAFVNGEAASPAIVAATGRGTGR